MGDEFKLHLVGWNIVFYPIKARGLRVRKLNSFNQALLGSGYGNLERKVIIFSAMSLASNMGRLGPMDNEVSKGTHGYNLWRSITEGWNRFLTDISFEVRDDKRVQE